MRLQPVFRFAKVICLSTPKGDHSGPKSYQAQARNRRTHGTGFCDPYQ